MHDRLASFDSDCPQKLISDILGFAYVESLSSKVSVVNIACDRTESTQTIVAETSRLLTICKDLRQVSLPERSKIETMLMANRRVLTALTQLNMDLRKLPIAPCSSFPLESGSAIGEVSCDG